MSVEHIKAPIVANPTFVITCGDCDFRHDSAAATAEDATNEGIAMHDPTHVVSVERLT